MSHKDGDVFYVIPEPDGRCELCGAVEETRPYGPVGKQICFVCGEKDPEGTKRRFYAVLDGEGS